MLLNVARKALVFHGAEGDVSDEAAMYLTEELIERYYYMSVAEISYVIRRNFTSKKYGKISASEILEWIRDYDSNERVEYLNMHESNAEDEEQINVRKGHCITYDEYLADIKRKAEDGDEESIQYLKDLEDREKRMISKNAIYQLYQQAKAEFFNKR